MASSTTQSNHVYVIIRLNMSENTNELYGILFCHFGEICDAFLIGGAVEPNETLITGAIRHCRRLVDFRLKTSHRVYLKKVFNGLIDHEPVKISIYVTNVLFNHLRWRARHHTPRLATITKDHTFERH